MNTRTIRVQGKGNVSQAPDRVRIDFTLTAKDRDFAKSVEACNERMEALRTAAAACKIAPAELKTTQFNVQEETEYDTGRYQHIGFQATHQMGLVLPIDRDLMGRFLSLVLRGIAKPRVSLTFEVADPEGLKQKVLARAVENAKRRAETIAMASGIKLGSIASIEYGYAEVRISSQPCGLAIQSAERESDIAPDFSPDDVEAEDAVTITWEITQSPNP